MRPENISPDGEPEGVLEAQYYLGDVDGCRVHVGETLVRAIAPGYTYPTLKEDRSVRLSIRSLMVFEDDGTLDEMLRIKT